MGNDIYSIIGKGIVFDYRVIQYAIEVERSATVGHVIVLKCR